MYILLYHSWEYIQRNMSQHTIHIPAQPFAALFIIAKLLNQPRCPSTDEWIKKMWYIYPVQHYLAIKNNETVICRKVDGSGNHHVKQSKSDSKRQILHIFPHMLYLDLKKNDTNQSRWLTPVAPAT
jgi:hypothetical protein